MVDTRGAKLSNKKEALKAILRDLHAGLSAEKARDRVLREVGSIETAELVKIEQELIDEGLPAAEITRFCNVHVLLVQGSLTAAGGGAGPSTGPVNALKRENLEIRKLVGELASAAGGSGALDRESVSRVLTRLEGLDRHYSLKENLIFPYLEKHGFPGPSKVMWQKDNEVRALHKAAVKALADLGKGAAGEAVVRAALRALADEADGMVVKEEDILLPAAVERLDGAEWAQIAIGMDELGYAFLTHTGSLASGAPPARAAPEPAVVGAEVALPSGTLSATELTGILNTLPLDISFVDAEGRVKYFSEGRERIFVRTRAVIGRSVANCHPPQSLPAVERVMSDLKTGKADHHDFWLDRKGRKIHIRYFAVRDGQGKYLGTLEVTQDVTEIRALQGEKRLIDRLGA